MSAVCECIETMDRLLEEKGCNTEIERAFVWSKDPAPSLDLSPAIIRTVVKTKKRGARPTSVFATFCPFCGVRYVAETGEVPA